MFYGHTKLFNANSELAAPCTFYQTAASCSISQHAFGGGGFTRPIPGDGAADQLRGVPIMDRLPTDGTRGPEVYGRIWPDADGPVQGSQARDVKDPVI